MRITLRPPPSRKQQANAAVMLNLDESMNLCCGQLGEVIRSGDQQCGNKPSTPATLCGKHSAVHKLQL